MSDEPMIPPPPLPTTPSPVAAPPDARSPVAAPPGASSPVAAPPGASSPVAVHLQRTQPWVRFLSIMGFILAGFMVLFGLVVGAAGAATGNYQTLGIMVMYPIMGVVYVFPSIFLLRYADRIKTFVASGLEEDLAGALDAQRSFWKFAGILTIVSIIFSLLFIAIAVMVGVFVGITGRNIGV
jgi:uncharacterized protein DUF5362